MRIQYFIRRNLFRPAGGLLLATFMVMAACGGSGGGGDTGELTGEYPITQTPELIARGLPLYTNNCAHCHGTGTKAPITPNTPTHSSDGHTWHHPDQMLVSWVLDGLPGAVTMPRYRGQLSEEEVRAVVAYIKTFWTDTQRRQQQAMSANFEANYR